ncbi:MAG TPA: DNA polymerase Y family protein [Xanthobacteraceae bacterium]|jgi:protein ImuB
MSYAASSRRRYLSVWLRRLATDRIARCASHASVDAPLVVAAEIKSALRLAAINDAAARLGLKPDMALADARAMYPAIAVADADPHADRRLLEAIADWCDRYTPLIGLDPPDGLLLDVTGCAHLFGGEGPFCRDIVRCLAAQGFHARVAIADTVGCAWAVARHGSIEVVSPEQTEAVLLALPLKGLRIAPETDTDLAQVGLKLIGDVISRPRAPLAARFGESFVRRIDQALGREDEPITPRLPIPAVVAERRFPDPIGLEADILATIEHLAGELKCALERRGEGARLLQVALFRSDGKVHRLEIGTAAPVREALQVRRLFAERLAALGDACDPGFGFDMVRLAALVTEPQEPMQTGLAAPDHAAELTHLIDRFGARFGLRRIVRLVGQDTHIPEFAIAAIPAHAAARHPSRLARVEENVRSHLRITTFDAACIDLIRHPEARARPSSDVRASKDDGGGLAESHGPPSFETRIQPKRVEDARERAFAGCMLAPQDEGELTQDCLFPLRPIRLFEHPERIEATAEIPDGPPVQFTWRRVNYRVIHAEGPERIAMPWWHDDRGKMLTRDYFRIESREGIRVWVYREGAFQPGAPASWFLHGLFA